MSTAGTSSNTVGTKTSVLRSGNHNTRSRSQSVEPSSLSSVSAVSSVAEPSVQHLVPIVRRHPFDEPMPPLDTSAIDNQLKTIIENTRKFLRLDNTRGTISAIRGSGKSLKALNWVIKPISLGITDFQDERQISRHRQAQAKQFSAQLEMTDMKIAWATEDVAAQREIINTGLTALILNITNTLPPVIDTELDPTPFKIQLSQLSSASTTSVVESKYEFIITNGPIKRALSALVPREQGMVIQRTEKLIKRYIYYIHETLATLISDFRLSVLDIQSRKAEARLASHRHQVFNPQPLSFDETVQANMDRQVRIYSKPRANRQSNQQNVTRHTVKPTAPVASSSQPVSSVIAPVNPASVPLVSGPVNVIPLRSSLSKPRRVLQPAVDIPSLARTHDGAFLGTVTDINDTGHTPVGYIQYQGTSRSIKYFRTSLWERAMRIGDIVAFHVIHFANTNTERAHKIHRPNSVPSRRSVQRYTYEQELAPIPQRFLRFSPVPHPDSDYYYPPHDHPSMRYRRLDSPPIFSSNEDQLELYEPRQTYSPIPAFYSSRAHTTSSSPRL